MRFRAAALHYFSGMDSRTAILPAPWHVLLRGAQQPPLLAKDRDRFVFLGVLHGAARAAGWAFHGYCLLPGEAHLVVEAPSAEALRRGLERVRAAYSRYWHAWYPPRARAFRGAPRATPLEPAALADVIAFIETAPVRAGLVEDAAAWPWSSAPARTLGRKPYLPLEAPARSGWQDAAAWRRRLEEFGRDARAQGQAARLLAAARPLTGRRTAAWPETDGPLPMFPPARSARAAAAGA